MPDKKSEEKRAFSAQLAMKIKVPVPFVFFSLKKFKENLKKYFKNYINVYDFLNVLTIFSKKAWNPDPSY